jgi:ureidoglycolate hydrolase
MKEMIIKRKMIRIRKLTREGVRPYAVIIGRSCVKDDGKKNCFGILLKDNAKGWRIGYLIVREKAITRLENHPDSFETFEPVSGKSVIAFAPAKHPDRTKVFLLDRGVVVKKGVWHEVAPLTKEAEIKIFENIEVKTSYHKLKEKIVMRG